MSAFCRLSNQPHLQNIHCNGPLVWFTASGTPSSPDPHRNSSWASCCCPKSWGPCGCHGYCSTGPVPSHAQAGHNMLGWANPRPKVWVWAVAELVSPNHWGCTPQMRCGVSSLRPMLWGPALLCPWWSAGVRSAMAGRTCCRVQRGAGQPSQASEGSSQDQSKEIKESTIF